MKKLLIPLLLLATSVHAQDSFKVFNTTPLNAGIEPITFDTVNNKLVFIARHSLYSIEPFVSDGTDTGTHILKDIATGTQTSNPTKYCVLGNRAYFSANNATTGAELYTTDGTSAGTYMMNDIVPSYSSKPWCVLE